MLLVPGATMFAGYALGLWLFPRSNTAQLVAAGIGVVPGALLYLRAGLWMHRALAEAECNQP